MSSGNLKIGLSRSYSRSRISLRISVLSSVFLVLVLHPIFGENAASEPNDDQYSDAQEKLASVADDIRDRLSSFQCRAFRVFLIIPQFSLVAEASNQT